MMSGPYRFWGKVDPRERTKPPIRAMAPEPDIEGTVATLRLFDPIDSFGDFWGVSAKEFMAALDSLPASTTDIRLHINSPGGEVYDGIAIMNGLRNHPARVTAIVDGVAASAASFIASSADELIMGPNTELMIHDAWGIVIGPAEDMHFMGNRLDAISNNIASVYSAKAGGSVADWRGAMLTETWYSADEAVAAGLADSVAGTPADASASNAFDMKGMFTYPSRAAAPGPAPVAADDDPEQEPAVDYAARFRERAHAMRARRMAS